MITGDPMAVANKMINATRVLLNEVAQDMEAARGTLEYDAIEILYTDVERQLESMVNRRSALAQGML